MTADIKTTTVEIMPPTQSITTWTQIAGLAASLLAYFGLNVSTDTIVAIILGIQAIVALVTIIRKTFFTKTVTTTVVANIAG